MLFDKASLLRMKSFGPFDPSIRLHVEELAVHLIVMLDHATTFIPVSLLSSRSSSPPSDAALYMRGSPVPPKGASRAPSRASSEGRQTPSKDQEEVRRTQSPLTHSPARSEGRQTPSRDQEEVRQTQSPLVPSGRTSYPEYAVPGTPTLRDRDSLIPRPIPLRTAAERGRVQQAAGRGRG